MVILSTVGPEGHRTQASKACLAALFLTDPVDDREKLVYTKGSRVDGTCEWIKTNPLYKSWLGFHSQLLWLSGGRRRDKDGSGRTVLYEAAWNGHEAVVRLLLEKGADVEAKDELGRTVLV